MKPAVSFFFVFPFLGTKPIAVPLTLSASSVKQRSDETRCSVFQHQILILPLSFFIYIFDNSCMCYLGEWPWLWLMVQNWLIE